VSCGQIEMVHARAHVLQQKYERIHQEVPRRVQPESDGVNLKPKT